jgi:hypothetical protein
MPSLSEAPNGGAKPFGSFLAFEKGTRCKSETISSRYRSNGYVLIQKKQVGYQAVFAGKPSSYRVRVNPAEAKQNQARLLLTTSNTSLDS